MTDSPFSAFTDLTTLEPANLGFALSGAPLPLYAAPPKDPMGHAPARLASSVRRTMTLDATWPDGRDGTVIFTGDARDILTGPLGGAPQVIAQAHIDVASKQRVLASVTAIPPRPELASLSGARAGGHLRHAIDAAIQQDKAAGTPLYLLLDDLAGATLVCSWAWSVWTPGWVVAETQEGRAEHRKRMEGVCIGFRAGSEALAQQGQVTMASNRTRVKSLPNPADPSGWHTLEERAPMNFRRARRMDVWREGETIYVDAAFQDSASAPDGGERVAIHEYRLLATANAIEGLLCTVEIKPGTLPYKECPAAMANVGELLGCPLTSLREVVLQRLRRSAGCTHLNDVLRALADTPALAAHLPTLR